MTIDTGSDSDSVATARPEVSIVVCTRNRAALLRDCLASVVTQRLPVGVVEVVVVDNGSTDDTAAVIATQPGVRAVVEPMPGVSRARNAGLECAAAELVAFLDDDARPEPGWVAALVDASRRWPDASAIGGPVVLDWASPPPSWLGPEVVQWFSAVDHGPTSRLLAPAERPVGTNLAVRRTAALSAGGFSLDLGRRGASLRSEEEVELLSRLIEESGPIAWEPKARVRHVVPASRMSRWWLVRRNWAQGSSDWAVARLEGTVRPDSSEWRAVAAALLRGWPRSARTIAASPRVQGMLLADVLRRTRHLARAVTALTDRS